MRERYRKWFYEGAYTADGKVFDVGNVGDNACMFVALGFPPLDPMPFMKLAHQVAQKLHALTAEGSDRVHDMVDLQIIMREDAPDVAYIKPLCIRLFAYRGGAGMASSHRRLFRLGDRLCGRCGGVGCA